MKMKTAGLHLRGLGSWPSLGQLLFPTWLLIIIPAPKPLWVLNTCISFGPLGTFHCPSEPCLLLLPLWPNTYLPTSRSVPWVPCPPGSLFPRAVFFRLSQLLSFGQPSAEHRAQPNMLPQPVKGKHPRWHTSIRVSNAENVGEGRSPRLPASPLLPSFHSPPGSKLPTFSATANYIFCVLASLWYGTWQSEMFQNHTADLRSHFEISRSIQGSLSLLSAPPTTSSPPTTPQSHPSTFTACLGLCLVLPLPRMLLLGLHCVVGPQRPSAEPDFSSVSFLK